MKIFKKENKLEQATIAYLVTQIVSKEDRNQLLNQFRSWDTNGDGVLSRQEIYDGYCKLYGEVHATEQVEQIMEACDLDKNGNIDYNEFLAFSLNRNKLLSKQNLETAFRAFDKVLYYY
jgi:calcium-dependent protein kinase